MTKLMVEINSVLRGSGMRHCSRVLLLLLLVLPSILWAQAKSSSDVSYRPDVTITLRTDIADGKLVYVSESGPTRGEVNPELRGGSDQSDQWRRRSA